MINLIINNKEVSVLPNTSVLKACEIAGFEIPRFCYHKRLSIAGNCRMCLVEVEKSPKPVVACAMPVMRGMVIFTDTPLVKKARENVLEFLLENHPLDCPICDQGGECDLQDQAMAFGSDRSRFQEVKRGVLDKNLGPLIKTIMTRCIHCTRCVRFGEEIAGIEDLGTTIRGTHTEIGTYLEKVFKTELSGNVIDLCPVGALTSKPYAFTARPWELKTDFIIDISDALGNKVKVDLKDNKIVRISPFYLNKEETLAESVENVHLFKDFWISDKTRFSYEGLPSQFNSYMFQHTFKQPPVFSSNLKDLISEVSKATPKFNDKIYSKISNQPSTLATTFICGHSTDLETLQSIKYFVDAFNTKTMSNQCSVVMARNFYLEKVEEETFYSFKTNVSIDNLEKTDLCLLLGVNPRYEGSLYNLHLRKRYKQGGFKIASIGAPVNLTYPIKHLGSNLKVFSELISNSHPFVNELRAAKSPMILVGSSLLENKEYFQIEALIYKFLNDIPQLTCSVFQRQANQLGALALKIPGLNSIPTNLLNASVLYLINLDPKEIRYIMDTIDFYWAAGLNFKYKQKPTVIIQGPRANVDPVAIKKANFIIPTKSHVEKEKSSFLNTEGVLQTSKGVVSVSIDKTIMTDSEILLKLGPIFLSKYFNYTADSYSVTLNSPRFQSSNTDLTLPGVTLGFFNALETRGGVSKNCYNNRSKITMSRLLNNKISFNIAHRNQAKIWASSVEDFYLTDNISLASPIMGKCSILKRTKSTSFEY